VIVAILNTTATAQVIVDDFDRADEALAGSTTSNGNGVWDSGSTNANTTVVGNRVISSGSSGSAYLPFSPPAEKTYSVQASTRRYGADTPNHSQAIGFIDSSQNPESPFGTCNGTGCWSGIHMAVEVGGDVYFWHNNFGGDGQLHNGSGNNSTTGLENLAGVQDSPSEFVDLKLEIDPVAGRARGYVNDMVNPLIDIPYSSTDTITGAGFTNSNTYGAEWDNFTVNAGSGTPVFSRSWKSDTSGDWNQGSNWSPYGVPNDSEQTVVFGDVITSNRVVFTETDVTVNRIQFASDPSYVVAGSGAINLAVSSIADAGIDVFQGDHQFQAAVNFKDNSTVTTGDGTNLTFNNTLSLGGNTLTKQGLGSMAIRNTLATGGGTVDILAGSVTGNGTVGGDVNNTSGTISPGDSVGVQAVVPEPCALILWILSALGLLVCRSRYQIGRH